MYTHHEHDNDTAIVQKDVPGPTLPSNRTYSKNIATQLSSLKAKPPLPSRPGPTLKLPSCPKRSLTPDQSAGTVSQPPNRGPVFIMIRMQR